VAESKRRKGRAAGDELEQVADRLHTVAIRLLRQLRGQDVQSGLSGPRLSALSVVVFGGPVTLGQLAAAEQVRPPTMTRLVRALEAEGLVQRKTDASDGRITWVRATAQGKRVLLEGKRRRVVALADRLGMLAAEDRAVVRRAVAALETLFVVRKKS
jgi:DNA-binding MarR family transcriptional regulator